jgi:hypothetical protein
MRYLAIINFILAGVNLRDFTLTANLTSLLVGFFGIAIGLLISREEKNEQA